LIDFSIYSLINDDEMIIQGRSLPFNNADMVPIGINIEENGICKLAIDNIEGSLFVEELQDIYIEDLYLNVIHDLRQSPYTFAGTSGVTYDRFLLRYNNEQALSLNDIAFSETFAFVQNGILKVNSSQKINNITIFDLTGKTIIQYPVNGIDSRFTSIFNFSKGAYLASIKISNGAVVTKKMMN
jgi:hypothetical protein